MIKQCSGSIFLNWTMHLRSIRPHLVYKVWVAQLCLTLFVTLWTAACQPPLCLEFSRQEYWSGLPLPSPGDLPDPGIEPRSPTLQADSSLSESPGKPKNTGVGSLSLLQGIFLSQESNRGLLHCRQILYQQRYQGRPMLPLSKLTWLEFHLFRMHYFFQKKSIIMVRVPFSSKHLVALNSTFWRWFQETHIDTYGLLGTSLITF